MSDSYLNQAYNAGAQQALLDSGIKVASSDVTWGDYFKSQVAGGGATAPEGRELSRFGHTLGGGIIGAGAGGIGGMGIGGTLGALLGRGGTRATALGGMLGGAMLGGALGGTAGGAYGGAKGHAISRDNDSFLQKLLH